MTACPGYRLLFSLILAAMSVPAFAQPLAYPSTRQDEVTDDYHGTKVADPYRWLEDDNSSETAAWVEAQNKVTFGFLESIPQRAAIRERLKTLWNYERYSAPMKEGGRYFFGHNPGLLNQSRLMVADSLAGEPRLLLDPNTLSTDGTVSLTGTSVSKDGKLLAYSLSRSGADWQEWHVRDVDNGRDLDDVIQWSKFSDASWAKDRSGFYYSRYDEPKAGEERKGVNEYQKLYFHKLRTPQSADPLIYERRDHKDWGFGGSVSDDGHWLLIHVSRGTDPKNAFFYRDLSVPDAPIVELLTDFDAQYSFIDNDGPVFFFQTDLKAPMRRVIAIDVTKPARENWREIISETRDTLETTTLVGGKLIGNYLTNAHSTIRVIGLDGKLVREVALPRLGSAYGFGGRKEDAETFYTFTSFTVPTTIYRYDVANGESTVFKAPKTEFDPSPYETKQVFATSKDGTRVPMFITLRRGLKIDRKQPVLLYGYGGFNVSLTPMFGIMRATWLEQGGIYVEANLRGGGEYGSDWHLAGTKERKQNVFDDFIACADWLIKNGYTSPQKLAIQGGSNGGLLVGAAMTQRPDLFGAALPAVGVLDMLRFHQFTIGWAWTSDYGSSDDAGQFKYLYAYSPYHHLAPGVHYPATLITTSDHDDRVVPAHSFKFAARLQQCQAKDGPPVLIRIETKAGHGAGMALSKVIDQTADELAFLVHVLKM
jgi:prolyl oligopeptidase